MCIYIYIYTCVALVFARRFKRWPHRQSENRCARPPAPQPRRRPAEGAPGLPARVKKEKQRAQGFFHFQQGALLVGT